MEEATGVVSCRGGIPDASNQKGLELNPPVPKQQRRFVVVERGKERGSIFDKEGFFFGKKAQLHLYRQVKLQACISLKLIL